MAFMIIAVCWFQQTSVVRAATTYTGGAKANSISPNGANSGPLGCGDGPCEFVGTQTVMTFDHLDIKDGIHGFGVGALLTGGNQAVAYFDVKGRTLSDVTQIVPMCRIGKHIATRPDVWSIRSDYPKVAAFVSMTVRGACQIEHNCVQTTATWWCGFTPPHSQNATNEVMQELNVHPYFGNGQYAQLPQDTRVEQVNHGAFSHEAPFSSEDSAYNVSFALNEGYYFGQSNPISTNGNSPVLVCETGCGGTRLVNGQFVPYTDNHHHYGSMSPYVDGNQIHVYDINGDGHKVCLRSGPPGSGCEPPTVIPTNTPTPTGCRGMDPPKSESYVNRVDPYTLKHSTPSWPILPTPTPTIITIFSQSESRLEDLLGSRSTAPKVISIENRQQAPAYYSPGQSGCATHRVDPINFVIWNDAAGGYWDGYVEIENLPWNGLSFGGLQNIRIDDGCYVPTEKTMGLNQLHPTPVAGLPSPTPDISQSSRPRKYQYHVRAAQSCRLTAANGHYERIGYGAECPLIQGRYYHIIEANGYNRGRDQAVQDLMATGLYRYVRTERWANTIPNHNCDGSLESGDGRIIVLERQ